MGLYNRIIDLQKLNEAWNHVKKNKPAAGVDNVTFEIFEENRKRELQQLNLELAEHRYEALPVRQVVLYKGEKARVIALYSMRDKVVQQSIAVELNRIYDGRLSQQTYAYRSNKSALVALDEIEKQILTGQYKYFLKMDIEHFFDTIDWNMLRGILAQDVPDEEVLGLIQQNAVTRMLEDTGEIIEKEKGIHQGSVVAPILSNVYLMDFDHWLAETAPFFIRYSDDLLVLGSEKENLLEILAEARRRLSRKGLKLNEQKTYCVEMTEGVDFLGHHFDQNGKSIPQKAKDNLQERLESMWLTSELDFDGKVKKSMEIIGGWEQYFREEREIGSIFEYLALLTEEQKNEEHREVLLAQRASVTNIYKDIAVYLGKIWAEYDYYEMELFEYEEFYGISKLQSVEIEPATLQELLEYYRKALVLEEESVITEIMQIYTDCHAYEKASFWMDRREKMIAQETASYVTPVAFSKETSGDIQIEFNGGTAKKMMQTLCGREDVYALETIGYDRKRQSEPQMLPLTESLVEDHLAGKVTIGTYLQRPNSTVKFIVVDVDVSKKIMLQYDRDTEEFKSYLEKARNVAFSIRKLYHAMGLEAYIEYSGCRGYHVWLLFTEWIPVRYANMFCEVVESQLHLEDNDLTMEYFPNKTRVREGKLGQVLKLPYGRHGRTGEYSYFLDDNGAPVTKVSAFLDGVAKFQLPAIKKVLAANTSAIVENEDKQVDMDLSAFGTLNSNVQEVLTKCNLMRYLCLKAQKTGYLSHFERLTVLYVFGHLGEEGKEFVHQVMSFTLNYQYNVTERFISKMPEKPISCLKLRDQYKQVTAEFGCNCAFKRAKNCYPSPVLHAIALSSEDSEQVTIPTSQSLSKEKEQRVIEDLNIHKKAQEMAIKILDMKKQKRKLDSNITKLEAELGKIYDAEGIDCLEIEMGLLVRRKTETGYEWVIEI